MNPRDTEIITKAIGSILRPILTKAATDLEDVLTLVEDLQEQLDDAEERIAALEGRL